MQIPSWNTWMSKGEQPERLKRVLAMLPDTEHPAACRLLYRLLQPKQEDRLTLRQALISPFLLM